MGAGTGLKTTPALTSTTEAYVDLSSTPAAAATDKWNRSRLDRRRLANTKFRVRTTAVKATTAACPAAAIMRIDHVRIQVYYRYTADIVTDPPVSMPDVTSPVTCSGEVLTPRGFWGMMLTQGSENDQRRRVPSQVRHGRPGTTAVEQPELRSRPTTTTTRSRWPPARPVAACGSTTRASVPARSRLGLRRHVDGATSVPVSSFYDLYDTQGTPYDLTDDTLVPGFTSGNTFRDQDGTDPALGYTGTGAIRRSRGCDAYHDGWYQLGTSTLTGDAASSHVYRLHTSTIDPRDPTAQLTVNGAERLGALHQGHRRDCAEDLRDRRDGDVHAAAERTSSEFYLAQIEAAHAGKTMEVKLFDAGDTSGDANIEILIPTAAGWSATNFNYTAAQGDDQQRRDQLHVICRHGRAQRRDKHRAGRAGSTAAGSPSRSRSPTRRHDRHRPARLVEDPLQHDRRSATDITTWQVQIRGNPVHLILP